MVFWTSGDIMTSRMVSLIMGYGLCCGCVYGVWVLSGFSLNVSLVCFEYVFGYSERVSFGRCCASHLFG